MQEFITIEKDPELKNSQSFELLKELGLKHIETLSSSLWTDYNEHDPGITLMEVLAYAITDLGYRTGYDVKDILTAENEALNNHNETFHKAAEILPCNQVTELDLREILIDIKGVRNAWIKIAPEFENTYWVDYDASVLSTTDPASTTEEEVTFLNGLYHIVVEFDRLVITMDQDPSERVVEEQKVLDLARTKLMEYRNFCEDYFTGERTYKLSNTPVTEVVTKPEAFEKIVLWADVEVLPESDMEKVHAQIYFDVEQFLIPYASFYTLKERLSKSKTIDEIFEGPLLENGFIDEEELSKIELFESIHTSDLYQVVMDVPGVKAIKTLKIANYISENGVEPLYDITIWENGELSLPKLLEVRGQEWCLPLSSDGENCRFFELMLDVVVPDLSDPINKTVKFYTGENSVPVALDTAKTLDQLNILRQNDRKRRERLDQVLFDLEVPEGTYQAISEYFPAQNELPLVYGTGVDGLADGVPEERKAQAKQLKGYMLFFEQLLTNYLAQLNNVRHLFSWDETIDKTYFTQLLEGIKDRGDLYVEEYDSLPLSPAGVLDEVRLESLIQADAENEDIFFDRRSRFLNHLIARFNEKFVEYTLIMHSMNMQDRLIPDKAKFLKEYDLISMNRGKGFNYIATRETIDTPPLTPVMYPDVWDTLNVTGYQHRVCRFLGFCDQSRRFLYSGHDMRIEAVDVAGVINYRYVLTINSDEGIEIIGTLFTEDGDAINEFDEMIENQGKDNVTNILDNPAPSEYLFIIQNSDTNVELGRSMVYTTAVERDDVLVKVDAYFDDVTAFFTDVVFDAGDGLWKFKVEVSSAVPPFFINGVGETTEALAQAALDTFLTELKADTIGFTLPGIGEITNNEFYFQVTDNNGDVIAISDHDIFGGSQAASAEGMALAEEFFSDAIGYVKSEGGLHVVEHILLRPKRDNYGLFDVDVRQYDSISTEENPPVAYPVDYDGVYEVENYDEQYFLSEEVDLSSPEINEYGESVNIVEPYFYTLSENQEIHTDLVAGTTATWADFLVKLQDINPNYDFSLLGGEPSVDSSLWTKLLDDGFGCDYANYVFGTLVVPSAYDNGGNVTETTTFNYYIIQEITESGTINVLGGLASAILSTEDIKERALRAFAYFCDNTTCKGIANPYQFRGTVVLPAWTDRARDYNYREFAEEIIRLEAPAHVALDIKWVNRAQMREFELCYRDWLTDQGEYLELDRLIQLGIEIETAEPVLMPPPPEGIEWLTTNSNVSRLYLDMIDSANCLIEKIDGLTDVFASTYKTVVRNDQYFTNNPTSIGYVMAWISDAADGSIVNKAEILSGTLPDFLGFFNGETIESNDEITIPGTFNAGDFMVLDNAIVTAGEWSFSVKTYSDTGQVSCTSVTIKVIADLEATYKAYPKCYTHLTVGDIVSKIDDPNGVVSSATILPMGDALPPELKLIEDNGDLIDWIALNSTLDINNYQPGDIVVNGAVTYSVNDPLAVPVSNNMEIGLVIQIEDITGGITVFTSAANIFNTGGAPGVVPLTIYGNAALVKNPGICPILHVATYDSANTIYADASSLLMEFYDGHEGTPVIDYDEIGQVEIIGEIELVSAVLTVDPLAGLDVQIVNGRVQIYVLNFALFEAYIEGLTPDVYGVVMFPIQIDVIDSCEFPDSWSGTFCVKQDTEATAEEDVNSCGGKYQTAPIIITISDANNGIDSYDILDAQVLADLAAMGVTHALHNTGGNVFVIKFKVTNGTLFVNAIESGALFNGTEIVNGVEVNVYNFDVDTYDFFGGHSIVSTKIYAPVNKPLECTKIHPDGTSYLAYLNNVSFYDPQYKFVPFISKVGKTVITFSDDNGIASISCSCRDCNGNLFPLEQLEENWLSNVEDELVPQGPEFGAEIEFPESQQKSASNDLIIGSNGKAAKPNKPNISEKAWNISEDPNATKEKFVGGYVNEQGFPYSPLIPPIATCECLANRGLALDEETHRIYVADSKLFAENGVGTFKFSITVVDGCGITTCKVVTLVIGNDKEAYYLDEKNGSYLNDLTGGDIIGYPEDPDGPITKADIVLYNSTSRNMASPFSPSALLPLGTSFNKITGEIKILEDKEDIAVYAGDQNVASAQKSANEPLVSAKKSVSQEPASNESGYSLFKDQSVQPKDNGLGSVEADWSLQNQEYPTSNVKPDSNYDRPWTQESPWIDNPGKLTSGKWTIFVLTRDIFGGQTVIEYEIVIKKNRVIKGIADNLGYRGGYGEVKTDLKNNYSNILSSKSTTSTGKENLSGSNEVNTK